ncbi:MAG: hypothetical protein DRO67_06415 [Candidatus Asgardarchaeum californiense]|nr:MAG: hypothetical protein DRO67_06415 [Candidatus Asgardarchaeum californiense]
MKEDEGWNILRLVLPDSSTINIAYKGNTIRIRAYDWKPIELTFKRHTIDENCICKYFVKKDRLVQDIRPKYSFSSTNKATVKGKQVFYVENPEECHDEHFSYLMNEIVSINNNLYKVLAVERFVHGAPWKKGEPIGLIVEEINEK